MNGTWLREYGHYPDQRKIGAFLSLTASVVAR